jgi:hypothetical protein
MTTFDDISEILDGPAGWLLVAAVGALVLYIGVKAIDNGASEVGSAISADVQKVSCWFNSCLFASRPGGCVITCALTGWQNKAVACVQSANSGGACPLLGAC